MMTVMKKITMKIILMSIMLKKMTMKTMMMMILGCNCGSVLRHVSPIVASESCFPLIMSLLSLVKPTI